MYEMYKEVEKENKGYVILVLSGIFYIALGSSAIILKKLCGLKPVCFKEGVCKCVIPVNSIDAYISKLASEEYNFVICKKEKFGMTEMFRYEGNKSIGSLECNCKLCWYYDKRIGKSIEEQVSIWELKYGKGRK